VGACAWAAGVGFCAGVLPAGWDEVAPSNERSAPAEVFCAPASEARHSTTAQQPRDRWLVRRRAVAEFAADKERAMTVAHYRAQTQESALSIQPPAILRAS